MWKRIQKRLSAQSGETLAEVLVALLIIALSSMLLVVMINTAARIDLRTRQRDKTFYEDLTHAETHYVEGTEAETGKVRISISATDSRLIDVTVHGGNGLTSYKKLPPEDGGA